MKKTWHKPGLLFIPSASSLSDPLCRRAPLCVPHCERVYRRLAPAIPLSPMRQVYLVYQQRPDVSQHPRLAYYPQLPV